MKYICIWLIRFYRKFLSPLKGRPTCRFTPTCSAYAIEAFQKRGFFVGFALTVWRILRCNPFAPADMILCLKSVRDGEKGRMKAVITTTTKIKRGKKSYGFYL